MERPNPDFCTQLMTGHCNSLNNECGLSLWAAHVCILKAKKYSHAPDPFKGPRSLSQGLWANILSLILRKLLL